MPKRKSSSEYPDYVVPYNKEGYSIVKRKDSYYLYELQPGTGGSRIYIGVITKNGLVPAKKRQQVVPGICADFGSIERAFISHAADGGNCSIHSTNIEVYEFGYSCAMAALCPESWIKGYGLIDGPVLLRKIVLERSPESYFSLARKTELSQKRFYVACKSRLYNLLEKESVSENELFEVMSPLKGLYDGQSFRISKVSDRQRELCSRYGITWILGEEAIRK